jgi:transcriptional regulator with XRE-family HTH domain
MARMGRHIREIRCFDMTQEKFAGRIGVSQDCSLERGKVEIGAEILLGISREFVKSFEGLLTVEE